MAPPSYFLHHFSTILTPSSRDPEWTRAIHYDASPRLIKQSEPAAHRAQQLMGAGDEFCPGRELPNEITQTAEDLAGTIDANCLSSPFPAYAKLLMTAEFFGWRYASASHPSSSTTRTILLAGLHSTSIIHVSTTRAIMRATVGTILGTSFHVLPLETHPALSKDSIPGVAGGAGARLDAPCRKKEPKFPTPDPRSIASGSALFGQNHASGASPAAKLSSESLKKFVESV
ncbi:hypothetical protein B0H13DRAFT_2344431 [Mycena leptocephala]|nr:hypothetical protein B0H13DRAFT_2344431 [Mycena leptocephala]